MLFNNLIRTFLKDAQTILHNAKSIPEISNRLSLYGYDEARLNQGMLLYKIAEALQLQQANVYGKQSKDWHYLYKMWKPTNILYSDHRSFAIELFENDGKRFTKFHLNEYKRQSLSGWLKQATLFYSELLKDSQATEIFYRELNIPLTELEEAKNKIHSVKELYDIQGQERIRFQHVIKERDLALDALQKFIRRVRLISKRAFRDQPELEILLIRPMPNNLLFSVTKTL